MSEHDLEQALRRALRPADPGEGFTDQVLARLDSSVAATPVRPVRHPRGSARPRWLPVALAAALVAAVGITYWQEQRHDRQRGMQAREQVLQALSIASANLNAARGAVLRVEDPIR